MAMKHAVSSRAPCKILAKAQVPAGRPIVKAVVPKFGAISAAAAILAQASPAFADDTVDSTVDLLIGAVKSTGDLVRGGINNVDAGVKILQQGYEVAAPYIEQGVKIVGPVAEQGLKTTADLAGPAIQAGLPYLSDAQKAVQSAVSSPTYDTVVDTANQAVTLATPWATRIFNILSNTEPTILAEYGLGALAFIYLAPPIFGLLGGSLRGYAGEITAASVLDSLTDNAVLIDIRSQKEKESSGVPDVPSSVSRKTLEVEFAVTEDKKLRNALRNPTAIEASVTALQIASLKSVSKSTKIILLDRYGAAAQAVAKELAGKGFGRVYIVAGGFDGRGGWVQSKLQIKPAASIMNAPAPAARTAGTFKSLPSPKA